LDDRFLPVRPTARGGSSDLRFTNSEIVGEKNLGCRVLISDQRAQNIDNKKEGHPYFIAKFTSYEYLPLMRRTKKPGSFEVSKLGGSETGRS
jgi:hypothetical protein